MYRGVTNADGHTVERPQNPRANANIFEIITFSWMFNLIKTGRLRDLEESDLYTTLDDHTSSSLGDQLEKTWKFELTNAYSVKRKPSLWRALFHMFGAKYILLGIMLCINEVICNSVQPLLVGELLAYFNPEHSKSNDTHYACLCASGLIFSLFVSSVLVFLVVESIMNIAIKIRIACCSLIFRKSLCLSHSALDKTTIGQVINLISNDVNRFETALTVMHSIWIGPLQTIVATYFLWQEIGVSSLIGVSTFLFFIPLQGWMGKKTSEIRLRKAKKTDDRIRLMNEIISGIQVIKMYTWEKPFGKLIEYVRKMEIIQIRQSILIGSIWMSFRIFQSRFQLFISILMYILLGNHITIRKVYVLTSFFNLLHNSMAVRFNISMLKIGDLMVTMKRIQNYLLLEEKDHDEPDRTVDDRVKLTVITNQNIANNSKDFENITEFNDINGIVILNASAKWTDDKTNNTLEKINLTVRPRRLTAVIGPVGAGKSSLIQAILRELPISEGSISVHGVVSYASQEPWLFSGSIRQNILFGSSMDNERYKRVIHICALNHDFEQFPHSDETFVGERGITLSGGQKSRINLARAVYKQADIYLLDDPLSAVDITVGKHLYEKCIRDYLKDKTCILITHQIQLLFDVDQIVLMDNGHIITEGSYQDLQGSSFDFAKLLGSSEGTKFESNNENNSTVDARMFSSLVSNKSIITSKNESKLNDVLAPKPDKLSQPYKHGTKNIFISYIIAGGSTYNIVFCFFMCIFTQILVSGGDLWLSIWVNQETYKYFNPNSTFSDNNTSASIDSPSSLFLLSNFHLYYATVYALFMVALIVSVIIRSVLFVRMTTESSINLHNRMLNSIIKTTMLFFNTHSTGEILNHCSKDIQAVDEYLPTILLDFIQLIMFTVGTIVIVGLTDIYLLIPTFIIAIIVYKLRVLYFRTSQSIRRLEGSTHSPLLGHVNASLQGLTTIRAFKVEHILSQEFDKHQDLHSSALHLSIFLNYGFAIWLNIFCLIYISIVISSFLVYGNNIYGGSVGLTLTQVIGFVMMVQWVVRVSTILENHFISVERILEYTHLPQEDTHYSTADKSPPKEWPVSGKIVFDNFNLRYSSDSPYVLKNLNIQIQPIEKVGIVGRTGAGKSSFIGALFRLALNEGNIIIDDINIQELALLDLRSKLSIIPQDPILFSGTMRKNLDPFNEYQDHVLWNALDEVELKNFVQDLPGGLNSKMSASGLNFSVGQRQLICLARAIIQNNKILVLDEATANVDPLTDELIQKTIRNKFRFCTVLTIAHRLNTIMDSDKVLVMDLGKIVEFDHPHNLLKNTDGFFYKMVKEMGNTTADLFHHIASEHFKTLQLTEKSLRK